MTKPAKMRLFLSLIAPPWSSSSHRQPLYFYQFGQYLIFYLQFPQPQRRRETRAGQAWAEVNIEIKLEMSTKFIYKTPS